MPGPTLSIGVTTYGQPPAGGWRDLLDIARAADGTGVDRINLTDHVVMGPRPEDYPWGRFPVPSDAPWLEPLTVIGAMAAVTQRVRLTTGILIAPLRPAALLAKTVATLDALSEGRVDIGVGTGWQRDEFDAEGLDFERRGERLTETVAACRALWESMPAAFDSPGLSFSGIYCSPPPVQQPLPIWFSGTLNGRNLRRIVELGDGWIPIMGSTVDDIAAGAARLREAFAAAGRDPATLAVSAPAVYVRDDGGAIDVPATVASVPRLAEAGVTDVRIELRGVSAGHDSPAAAMAALRAAFDRAVR